VDFRQRLLSTTSLAVAFAASASVAVADEYSPDFSVADPAVSAVNGKLGAFGGAIDDEGAFGAFGSLAVPLGGQFGAQIDGMVGSAEDAAFYGIGGHLFWRDPSRGLIGLYTSYVNWDGFSTVSVSAPVDGVAEISGAEVGKVGIEGEAYLGRFSLEGLAAYQFGSETGFAGNATVAYYPIDDLRFDLSASHLEGVGVTGSAGVEWMPPTGTGLSLFADASVNEHSTWSAFGGIKLYLAGEQKSLIRRHREDDPDVDLPADVYKITGAAHCPAGSFDDGGTCFHD
jgi:hypothetical protein